MSVKLTNGSDQAIFIPDVKTQSEPQLVSLQIMRRSTTGQWGFLGPFHDVPAGSATVLQPAQALSYVQIVHDPSIVVPPGNLVPHHKIKPTPLGGEYKIVLGYYSTQAEWQKYLEVLNRNQMPKKPPILHYVESKEFTIRPAK